MASVIIRDWIIKRNGGVRVRGMGNESLEAENEMMESDEWMDG